MKRKFSKTLAVLMCVMTAVAFMPSFAFAAESSTINVYVSISDQGTLATDKNGNTMAWSKVKVSDADGDGTFTLAEALTSAHEQYCADGADGFAYNTSSGWVTKLWGNKDNAAPYSFIKNNAMTDVVTSEKVAEGDYVTASINQDAETYLDYASFFNSYSKSVKVGSSVTLNLKGMPAMSSDAASKISGVEVGTISGGSFKKLGTTDKNGNVKLSFSKAGTYVITAKGNAKTTTDLAQSWTLMEVGKYNPDDENSKTVYGKMDWTTYESFFGYTKKDYGDGPYPYDEIIFESLYDEDYEMVDFTTFAGGYPIYSGVVTTDAPLIAPTCVITVSPKVPNVTIKWTDSGYKKAFVGWKKVSGISGYQVAYYANGIKQKTVNVKASKKQVMIKKLKRHTKYSFKVRAYKTVDGVKYYGKWSKVKKAKVK